jgi:hypothetical protein
MPEGAPSAAGTGGAIGGTIVIFDPLDYGSYCDVPADDTVYQGQVAPQDAESLPDASPRISRPSN